MAFLGFGKKDKGDDINWKKKIFQTYTAVEKHEEKFNNINTKQDEYKATLKDHCDVEVEDKKVLAKEWGVFKDTIVKKIDDTECPKSAEVEELVKNKTAKNAEMKELTATVVGYSSHVVKYVNLAEGEKQAWKKIRVRTAYALGVISAIIGIVTKIIGVW